MEQPIPWDLLAKSFSGELTPEEEKEINEWRRADPSREGLISHIFDVWLTAEPYQLNADKGWFRLKQSMEVQDQLIIGDQNGLSAPGTLHDYIPSSDHEEQVEHHAQSHFVSSVYSSGSSSPKPAQRRFSLKLIKRQKNNDQRYYRYVMLAASLLIVMLGSVWITQRHVTNGPVNELSEILETRELVAGDGEWASYLLADGSKVILHAGSRLHIPGSFGMDSRQVHLEGEAYFEVEPDEEYPFIVSTDQSYTRVLGTRFLVQSWAEEDGEVEVIVAEGRVAVGKNGSSHSDLQREVVLTGNQHGKLHGSEELVVTDLEDVDWYLGWTEGRLIFNDRPLNDVIFRLERWYAVNIVAEDDIGERRITAELDYSLPMKEVMKSIAMTLDLELEIEDRLIWFTESEGIESL